jgi:bifunctional oligoribonuclease and PAP phosphatase NrnA
LFFSVFIREDADKLKVSLRSRGNFAVNQVSATHFNGGGHLNAAGGESTLSIVEAEAYFEKILPSYKDELSK